MMLLSCSTRHTPKPSGYARIELPPAAYTTFSPERIPCTFQVSMLVAAENLPPTDTGEWIRLLYPSLSGAIHCSYLPVTRASLENAFQDSYHLLVRQAEDTRSEINQYIYEDPSTGVYASLFELSNAPASPLQFVVTDSVSNFFRGTLLYDRFALDTDSLAPVTEYIKADIRTLIESFRWTHP
jgi:gliding motility-associated lipoprotein GldD